MYLARIFVVLGVCVSIGLGLDPCYDIQNPTYGNIGNCIPATACSSGITVPSACPSYLNDYVCCFDEQFPGREVRGAWIATVANIDWPISPSDSVTTQRSNLITMVDRLWTSGFNTIYFQVRPHGDALYSSAIEPWSEYLTGRQGQPPNPLWDPLEFIIRYAHSRDIEVHAWINPYRANMRSNTVGLSPMHMAIQFPQYAYPYGTFLWMDPGADVVQNRTYDVAVDLITRYDLDGLHMDDYFYPYPVTGVAFPDSATYNRYLQNGGTMNLADWRRNNVNVLVERLNTGLHQVKPWIKFSISPFGIYRPGHPEGMPRPIAGLDQYSELYSDPKLWLQEGWVDVLQPQLYWLISAPNQSYPMLLDWWVEQDKLGRHVYAGNYLSRVLENPPWPLSEITEQVRISRLTQHRSRGSWGNVMFSAKVIYNNNHGSINHFRTQIYPYPAIQPAFPWLANNQPLPQTPCVTSTRSSLSWNSSDGNLHKVVIYKKVEDKWQVFKIMPKSQQQVNELVAGSYAISALDRFGRESEKTFIQI